MKRTKGAQSELGMMYQYAVTALMAAELSMRNDVEDYLIYSSEKSAGKFDDIAARIKLKSQKEWCLSLVQVKYKETSNLNVSDLLKGTFVQYVLSNYVETFNNIMTNPSLVCRQGIPSDHIRFGIFCNKTITTPVFLRNDCTFQLNTCKYSEKDNTSNTVLPFGNKRWKFTCKDLENTEYQRFFDGCILCLEQPNANSIYNQIQTIYKIPSANDIVNYVKDYFNNDCLYKKGLRKEVFEMELQRIHFADVIPPLISLVDLVDDDLITAWNEITLYHDLTIVYYNEDREMEVCLYSCLAKQINTLLNISIDWKSYISHNKYLNREIINQFVAYSKEKAVRYWITAPNTLNLLMIELWKCGDLPLILRTRCELEYFEKFMHLRRSYIIIDDWRDKSEAIPVSKLKVFSCLSDIVNIELREKILKSTLASLQGRKVTSLKTLLGGNKDLMSTFFCADIIGMMKKKAIFVTNDCFKGRNYIAFIIRDDNCAKVVELLEPYAIGNNIRISCHPSKIEECVETIATHPIYKNYIIYHLQATNGNLVLIQGDRVKLNQYFVDQYGEPLYSSNETESIPIIGQQIISKELHYISRQLRGTTISKSLFSLEEIQICLMSGDLDNIDESTEFCTIEDVINKSVLTERKTYFIKIEPEKRQHCWYKLRNIKYPTFEVSIQNGKTELLKYKHCSNLISHISYDGKIFAETDIFDELNCEDNRIIVITGEAGIGKSSLLRSLCNSCSTTNYILFYDLINFQIHLNSHKNFLANPIEFLLKQFNKRLSKKYADFIFHLWKKKKLIVVLDSFEEVRSICGAQLLQFIRTIADSGIRMLIASRLEDCKILMDEFSARVIKIHSLNSDERNEFLEYHQLIAQATNVPNELANNPLYLSFLKMIYVNQGELLDVTKFVLYEKVLHMQIKRYLERTSRILYDCEIERVLSSLEKLALVSMFGRDTIEQELLWTYDIEFADYAKFGIITTFNEGNCPVFQHYSFVEFLVTQWLVKAHTSRMYRSTAKYLYKQMFNEGKLHVLNILTEDLQLHKTVLQEDISKVEVILTKNPSYCNIVDNLGRTALHLAAIRCGSSNQQRLSYQILETIIQFMLQNGQSMNISDGILDWNWADYFLPEMLEYTWLYNYSKTIAAYLRLRKQQIQESRSTTTTFTSNIFHGVYAWAVECSYVDVIADLLLVQNFDNTTFYKFYQSCINLNGETVPSIITLPIEGHLTPIHIACIYGATTMIQKLISVGVDVNAIDGFTCTPLHYAIMRYTISNYQNLGIITNALRETIANTNTIKLLLEAGADTNISHNLSEGATTALHLAVQTENVELVKMVLQYGADTNCWLIRCQKPLHLAAESGKLDVVQCLLDYGAHYYLRNVNGETARDVAIRQGHTDISDLLSAVAVSENLATSILLGNEKNVVVFCKFVAHGRDKGDTRLHDAALYNNINLAKILLKKGADINAQNKDGYTPLHVAARLGSFDVLKGLLDNRADIEVKSKHDETALFLAACEESGKSLQILLEHGANIDFPNKSGETPLHNAVIQRNTNATKVLLQQRAKVDAKSKYGSTPILIATENGDTDMVQLLLDHGAKINVQTEIGNTALHSSVSRGLPDITQMLLERGANVNIRNKQGLTPLQIGAIKENIDSIGLLLQKGATVNVQDLDDFTPLHVAAGMGNEDIVKILLKNAANVNARSKNNATALTVAIREGNMNAVHLLLEANAEIDSTLGATALQLAAVRGHLNVVRLLLNKGVDPDISDKCDQTPLYLAAERAYIDIVKLLLEKNADVNAKNKNGSIPLHGAVMAGCTNVIHFLLNKGAKVNSQARDGCTPLHIAAIKGNIDTVKLLLEAGADVTLTAEDDLTPSRCAILCKQAAVLELLLHAEYNANSDYMITDTDLCLATAKGNTDILLLLLNQEKHICIDDRIGTTLLRYGVNQENTDILKRLLHGKLNVNIQDTYGNTALHLAVVRKNIDILRLLLDKGAKPHIANYDGVTPLHISICEHCRDIYSNIEEKESKLPPNECDNELLGMGIQETMADIILLLLQNLTDNHLHSKDLSRIFVFATQSGYLDITTLLLNKGIDPNVQDDNDNTPMHIATIKNRTEIVQLLLQKDAIPDIQNKYGSTPLHIASYQENIEIVGALLAKKANVNLQNEEGRICLHMAVKQGNVGIIKLLSNTTVHVNSQDKYGNTSLHIAVYQGCIDVALVLCEMGADVNIQNEDGCTPLHYAVEQRHVDVIKFLLNKKQININIQDRNGNTYLHHAISNKYVNIVNLLLETEVNVNIANKYGNTPLHFAVHTNNKNMVRSLLGETVNINASNQRGCTPIHNAVTIGNLNIVDLLLEAGADVAIRNNDGNTPLHLAINKGSADSVTTLLQRTEGRNLQNNLGSTPLHISVFFQKLDIVWLLLEAGVNVNIPDNDGITPLHIAVKFNNVEIITILLEIGADVDIADKNCNTPLHYAVRKNRINTISLLLEKESNVNVQNKYGCTPLHLSVKNQNIDVMSLLLDQDIDVNLRDIGGNTPLHLAIHKRNAYIFALLLKNKANVTIRNKKGKTPLQLAIARECTSILKLLLPTEDQVPGMNTQIIRTTY